MSRHLTHYPTITNEAGEEEILPYRYQICGQCRGHGKSSAYLGAFTGGQMREDPEFFEDYMAGHYDRTCETCGGSGKVAIPHWKKMSAAQKKAWRAHQEVERSIREDERSEYRMSQEYLNDLRGGW
jgi:hypothetical protein